MEKSFPDSSSDLYVSTDEKCVRSLFFALLKGISERPVIETENKYEKLQNVNNSVDWSQNIIKRETEYFHGRTPALFILKIVN